MKEIPPAIIFFGPDGVGKTTQAMLLTKFLQSKSYKTIHAWIRGRHTIAYVLSNLFIRLGYYRLVKVQSGASYKIFDPHLLFKMRSLWGFIEFASVLPLIIIKVYFPMVFGFVVVADRYVIDTVVYLGYWLGDDFLNSCLSKLLLRFIPKHALLIHLDAQIQTLTSRLYDDTSTRDFLAYQIKRYRIFARNLQVTSIDTTKNSIQETFDQIARMLYF